MDSDVEACHAEVEDRSGECRAELKCTSIGVDGFLGVPAIRESRSEAVPEEVILHHGSACTGTDTDDD